MRRRGQRAAFLMARIAYLTGRRFRGRPFAPGEVHPFEQSGLELTQAAGRRHGLMFEPVFWDDVDAPQRGFDAAIIRSCWDYHERPDEFVATLEAHEGAGLRVFNDPRIVRWNARKTYLQDLGDAAIETVWADKVDSSIVARAFDALGVDEIVLKPQFGGGSFQVVRLRNRAWGDADLRSGPTGPAMIQPFLRAIETEGERSLFWFGGAFSHAVRKTPKGGDWRANIPGETQFVAEAPPAQAMQIAEAARVRAPADLLYVRIDLVLGDDGRWRVIEIEAIEPYLFLDLAPEGADRFVSAIARVLGV